MRTSKDLYDEGKRLNPDAYIPWDRCSLFVKEHLTCLCERDFKEGVARGWPRSANGTERIFLSGEYCLTCLLPTRFSVVNVLQTCEECSKYYVPSPDTFLPAKVQLCGACDSGATLSSKLKGKRVTKLRWS